MPNSVENIELYFKSRENEKEHPGYQERFKHFNKLKKCDGSDSFEKLKEQGIKQFSSVFKSNKYANLLKDLKFEDLAQPLQEMKQSLYILAPRFFKKEKSLDNLLNAVNTEFASIFKDKNDALTKAKTMQGTHHAIIEIQLLNRDYIKADTQHENITDIQLKRKITKDDIKSITDTYEGNNISIEQYLTQPEPSPGYSPGNILGS